MENKIILITGSTDGIGKATAKTLAQQGHTIIIHGRSRAKAEAVKKEIQTETGNDKIDILVADLLSLSDIKDAVQKFKMKYSRLDVLINNAGAIFGKHREVTKEGFEKTITLNLFAPLLLMQSLLDLLSKSPSARIINISSPMHKYSGKPDLNDLQMENGYRPDKAYGLAKLYLIWITRYFAKELKRKGIGNVTANTSHPGAVATKFGKDADKGFIINMVFKISALFYASIEDGAKTGIYLATSDEVEGVSGEFFGNKANIEKPDDKYYAIEGEKLVWDYSMNIIKTYL